MENMQLEVKTDLDSIRSFVIEWNNDELLATVSSAIAQYEGITYTDAEISNAKKDKAEVDEVLNKVKAVSDTIDAQVKAYDEKKKAEKLENIKQLYFWLFAEYVTVITFEQIYQPKWMNSTVKIEAVESAMNGILTNIRNGLDAIESLHSDDEISLKQIFFKTLDLSQALSQHDLNKAEKARIYDLEAKKAAELAKELAAKTAEKVAENHPDIVAIKEPAVSQTPSPEENRLYTVNFSITTSLDKLKALKLFLTENGIKYTKI